MKRTQSLRDALPYIVKKYEIKTFLDAPCGDFHWMKALAPTLAIHYIGADIVKDLIAANQARYKNENVTFITIDLTKNLFPEADILFCRDCLFHLSYRDIAMVFRNFINSNCRFLMTTSHINKSEFKNSDIKTGDWRWFDLFQEPFKFPQNYIEAVIDGGGDRYMYLWRKEDIASAIEGFMQNCLN